MINKLEIKKLYFEDNLKQEDIAIRFNVSRQRISQILKMYSKDRLSRCKIIEKICIHCGKKFIKKSLTKIINNKYCSNKCFYKSRIKYKSNKERSRAIDISHNKSLMKRYHNDEQFRLHRNELSRKWWKLNRSNI